MVSDGWDALATIFATGTQNVFGTLSIAALIAILVVVGILAYIGLDVVAAVCLGGLLAIGFAFYGWLPFNVTMYVVMVLWGLGFAYFILLFYNR